MQSIDKIIENFVNGDYFIVFLITVLVILVILVLALIKSREDYNELMRNEQRKFLGLKDDEEIQETSKVEEEHTEVSPRLNEDDLMYDLKNLMASSNDDVIDADKPLIKQVDLNNLKTYNEVIDEHEQGEEENAVISTEELEQKAKERMELLGSNENQETINKYEEEQEKKAIISYEELIQNASNISLSYKRENKKDKDAPTINKIELEQKEVVNSNNYIAEQEFLEILKEFRISL